MQDERPESSIAALSEKLVGANAPVDHYSELPKVTRHSYAGETFPAAPCNWCRDPVRLSSQNTPLDNLYKDYGKYFAVYCCDECMVREYDYLFQEYPDSLYLNGPVPEFLIDLTENH